MSVRLDGPPVGLTCVLVAALSFACAWFGPWWAVALPSAVVGLLSPSVRWATGIGALSAASAWLLMAFVQDALVGFRLSGRIGGILQAPLPSLIAYVVTAAIAGVVCALVAWSGFALRDLVWGRGGAPAAWPPKAKNRS